jgi:hypothetical protein
MCSCPLVGKGSGLGLRSSFITAPQPAAGSDAPMILRCYGRICTSSQCGIASVPVGSRIAWSCSARPVVMRGSSTCGGSLRCMRNIATKRARIAARGLLARPYLRIEKPRTGKCGRA